MKKTLIIIVNICLCALAAIGQNKLKIIQNLEDYRQLPNDKKLVALQDSVPFTKVDIVYATSNNFTHTQLYTDYKLLITKYLASSLKKAAIQLKKKNIGLLIYDGYRPYSVSKKMWEIVHDDRYVANPVNGSDHNRGTAIDLSLYDLKTGKPLLMPTPFDDFTEKAHLSYLPTSKIIRDNRNLLQKTMRSVGLQPLSTEWWHFSLPDSKQYAVLDLDFSLL